MKYCFSIQYAIIFLLISCTLLFPVFSFAGGGPVLQADQAHKNIGNVREGIKVHIHFTIKNGGDSDARITDIETSAACTASNIPKRVLKPGESMKMDFIFETLGYGGRSTTRSIKINYNNKELSPLELKVTGEVMASEPYQAPVGELTYNMYLIVDIRSEALFRNEHIIGAVNIPEGNVEEWIAKIPKDMMIYLYSDSGKQSDEVARKLHRIGYAQAMSLIGGIKEWKNQYGDKYIITGSQ